MVPNTKSYKNFKKQSERLTNLAVLFSHAVPVLSRVLASTDASALVPLKPADNFPHDKATGPMLLIWSSGYSQDLAHTIVLNVFSYFEAYIRGALKEIYDRQGGHGDFLDLAQKRITRHWNSAPAEIAEARRMLLAADDKAKAGKLKKYTKVLVDAGFAFPPDLLAVYGARQLAKKIEPKGRNAFKAFEIPELLEESILFKVGEKERVMYEELRLLRNDIAHGSNPNLSIHSAIKKTAKLRTWAARIDEHVGKHFLVLAKYAP
jgi:hypothetical protein